MNNIINNAFKHINGATRYTHIKVGRNKSYFISDPLNGDNKYTANEICKMIEFLVDNIYIKRKLATKFILSYRYTDDLTPFNNKRFKEFISSDILPQRTHNFTESASIASYLGLLFIRDKSKNITIKLYDAFGFHIVKFPFMSSNIPSAPGYGVYASQLIHYARCCSNYSDFL